MTRGDFLVFLLKLKTNVVSTNAYPTEIEHCSSRWLKKKQRATKSSFYTKLTSSNKYNQTTATTDNSATTSLDYQKVALYFCFRFRSPKLRREVKRKVECD